MLVAPPQAQAAPSRRRALAACTLLLAALAPFGAAAEGNFGIDSLLALLGKHDALRATFHERKFVKQLDGPVDSSGELSFDAPATMVKRTIEPRPETVRLDGRTITLERGRQTRTLQVDDHPEIAIYIEAIRAALAGDKASLDHYYRMEVSGGPTRWKLDLAPKDPKLAEQVKTIELAGVEGVVRQVEVRLADGDYSVMSIEQTSTK